MIMSFVLKPNCKNIRKNLTIFSSSVCMLRVCRAAGPNGLLLEPQLNKIFDFTSCDFEPL